MVEGTRHEPRRSVEPDEGHRQRSVLAEEGEVVRSG
jgi:hypothetical protein